jgi:hypothetical protein
VAPWLGRYAADVQFKMVRCAFDRDQLVMQHAARVIHLLQAAVDGGRFVMMGRAKFGEADFKGAALAIAAEPGAGLGWG